MNAIKPQIRRELIDPRTYVRYWFKTIKSFKMQPNGHFKGNNKTIFANIWLDYEELHAAETVLVGGFDSETGQKRKLPKMTEKNVEKAWVEFLNLEAKQASVEIFEAVKFNAHASPSILEQWAAATIGAFTAFDLAVLKHTLWQIKRKMFDKKVVYHIAPCFWGEQGAGKTEAVKKLLEPMQMLMLEWGINDAVDGRNTQTLADNYICLFDEMAGLQRVEIESLKRIVSADFLNYRPMRTNDQIKVQQNCTFIGISNKSLTENIYDSTGLRRFVEFKTLKQLDWAKINAIDSLQIWQSIDENNERGYIEGFASELKQHQQSLMVRDELQDFVADMNIVGDMVETKEILVQELYDKYIAWRGLNGYSAKQAPPKNYFSLRLRTQGLTKREVKVDGKEKIAYTVNAASDLFKEGGPLTPISRKVLEFKK